MVLYSSIFQTILPDITFTTVQNYRNYSGMEQYDVVFTIFNNEIQYYSMI